MKSSQWSTKPVAARGMSKIVTLILMFCSGLVEFILFSKMMVSGWRSLGEVLFVVFLWNLGILIALTIHFLKRHPDSYPDNSMEVSNYLNLNKLGKDK